MSVIRLPRQPAINDQLNNPVYLVINFTKFMDDFLFLKIASYGIMTIRVKGFRLKVDSKAKKICGETN